MINFPTVTLIPPLSSHPFVSLVTTCKRCIPTNLFGNGQGAKHIFSLTEAVVGNIYHDWLDSERHEHGEGQLR